MVPRELDGSWECEFEPPPCLCPTQSRGLSSGKEASLLGWPTRLLRVYNTRVAPAQGLATWGQLLFCPPPRSPLCPPCPSATLCKVVS